MDDLRQRFTRLDGVPVPDIWSEVERRLEALGSTAPTGRLAAVRPEWRGQRIERTRGSMRPMPSRRTIVLLMTAGLIAALVIGGALAVGSELMRLRSVVPPSTEATPTNSPAPSAAEASPSPEESSGPDRPSSAPPSNGVPAFPGMFAQLQDRHLASDTVGWVATSSAIYRTADGGLTWTDVRPRGSATTSATSFVDADTTYLAWGGSPVTIGATHDGGASWVQTTLDVGTISGGPVFSFQTPLSGFATFYDPDGTDPRLRVYATIDGGVTWTGPRTGNVPHMAASFDKLNGPIEGFLWQSAGKFDDKPFDNRFFLSADGAATWTQYTFPIGEVAPKNALKSIVGIVRDDSGRITLAITADGGDPSIYESTDDPTAWQLVGTMAAGFDVQLLSPTEWVGVAGSSSEIRSTVDAGEHWRTTVTPTRFREIPQFATPDDGWLIAFCSSNSTRPRDPFCDATTQGTMLSATSDGGATWTRIVH